MKVSEISTQQVVDYLRLDDPTEIEETEVEMFMDSAKETIRAMTGLTDEEIDTHADMVHPFFLLVSEQFDNRNGHLESKQTTKNQSILETLRRYAVNYV